MKMAGAFGLRRRKAIGRLPFLARMKERGFSGAFLGLVLVTMAGWVDLLGSIFLKCVFWCFS
jgi:hypothetical protein